MSSTDPVIDFLEIGRGSVPDSARDLLLDLLAQDDVWQDSVDGSWRPIAAIPIGRALCLLGSLEIRAKAIANAANTQDHPASGDPLGWIRSRPFYRALAAQIGHDLARAVRPLDIDGEVAP